ncbi:hypothetical protein SR1949_49700 [Sphaerospermopsis reniformis]|jgi:hypothetical protein|uniref:Uncharacterized protein n=1 Tax=Sphaerospermopsis reniformis TaxID=531300 RepID=A0A480A4T0_9CYAN|nr:hypothetical protein NIES73_43980 [Sphaerospermopsis kisseleviana NIES-73]GCL39839.1 hypothetical protein SR1949_49700 [Sphaerospermopsis reniformis]
MLDYFHGTERLKVQTKTTELEPVPPALMSSQSRLGCGFQVF